jgi:hypothetical protein
LRIVGLFIGEADVGEEVERIDDQEKVVLGLQVDVPGVRQSREESCCAGA